jgi:sporulation protein YlmC with PRC-barrel domain
MKMIAKHLAMAFLGTALISAPALAQTQAPGSTTTAPSTTTTAPASGMSSSMSSGNFMTQMQANQWEVSNLEGLDVYNNANEKIGDISELIVDQSGKIQAVVIGVGGFLGMGERDVAIPFEQIKFMNEPRANATASNAPATTGTATTGGATTTTTAPATTGSTGTMGTAGTAPASTDNNRRNMPDHAMLDMTKDQLKAAPEFKSDR